MIILKKEGQRNANQSLLIHYCFVCGEPFVCSFGFRKGIYPTCKPPYFCTNHNKLKINS